jgi:hypothetical protein
VQSYELGPIGIEHFVTKGAVRRENKNLRIIKLIKKVQQRMLLEKFGVGAQETVAEQLREIPPSLRARGPDRCDACLLGERSVSCALA